MCHHPDSSSRRILQLPPNAVAQHLAHGDYLVAAETCDGADNDCDGAIDEGFGVGAACGVGVCAGGVSECDAAGTGTRCSTGPGGSDDRSGVEICDGADNDCDGTTDNGFGVGVACGVGECAGGISECDAAGTGIQCSTGPAGSGDLSGPELCDALDNDCDGEIDEGPDYDGDGIADGCDNCPTVPNSGQEDSDPACGSDGDSEADFSLVDFGDACDTCDHVCDLQIDTRGIRAQAIAFSAPLGADCVESADGYHGETDDLELGDDELSPVFDLDDENGDGVIGPSESGDFEFTFFGKVIDRMVISSNGFVYLLGEGESLTDTDSVPSARTLPRYDGVDFIVAALWTDLKGSRHAAAGQPPCISWRSVGDNDDTNQIVEITFENMYFKSDVGNSFPVTSQIRLYEADDRIEIHTTAQPASQPVTRGVEGLFDYAGYPAVGAAFLQGDNNMAAAKAASAVLYATRLEPELDPSIESGDACDNATVSPQCGDGVCYLGGGEGSLLCPVDCYCGDEVCDPASESSSVCPADCVCGDGMCDAAERTAGICPTDCPQVCGDLFCDVDRGETADNCPSDCF